MKKLILLFGIFIGLYANIDAQQKTNTEFKGENNLVNYSADNANTVKSTKEIKGDKFFFRYSFDKAIRRYSKAKDLTINGQRNLAESYLNLGQYENADDAYLKLLSNQTNPLPEDLYNYASLLKNRGKYKEAFTYMDKFSEQKPNDLRSIDYLKHKHGLLMLSNDNGYFKINELNINTNADDFGAAFYKKQIVYASTRAVPKMILRTYNWTNKPFWSLYVTDVEDGQLKKGKKFNKKEKSKNHDGPASFSNDGNFMAFTRNKINDKSKDNVVELLILFSEFKDDKWSEPVPFALNNKEYQVAHPSLSSDGNTMYFASDMPGGYGGSDIYRVTKLSDGSWSAAENLGSNVNTEGDEMFPFFESDSQVLFFSSNGRFGLGGLDVFYVAVSGSNVGNAKNLGFPLNTQYDDYALIIDEKFYSGYFSSNRTGGKGGDDIYGFDLLKNLDIDKRIEGIAKDVNAIPIPETKVLLMDSEGYLIDSVTTKDDGEFSFFAAFNKNYKVIGKNDEYLDGYYELNTFGRESIVNADITLLKGKEVATPEVIVEVVEAPVVVPIKIGNLNNIYFDFDSYDIRTEAEVELNKIVKILNDNPNIEVELRSYTDSRASAAYNMVLSNNRANSSVNYIKERISNPDRISGKGFGETNLVNDCAEEGDVISNCSEAEHQLNRRTEFFIVK